MKSISSLRVLLIFLLAMGTGSCGFTPVYKSGSKAGIAFSEIFVADPGNDRNRYLFVVEMEQRLGRNTNGNLLLNYNISMFEQVIGNFPGERIQLFGRVDYNVISVDEDRSLFTGSQDNFVSFSPDEYLRTTASEEARARLIAILAHQVIAELTARFSSPLSE